MDATIDGVVQHEEGLYWRLDEATIRQILMREGSATTTVNAPAGQHLPIRRRDSVIIFAVVHGDMVVKTAAGKVHCLEGDKLTVPAGVDYAVTIGPGGCIYLWTAGDSCE